LAEVKIVLFSVPKTASIQFLLIHLHVENPDCLPDSMQSWTDRQLLVNDY